MTALLQKWTWEEISAAGLNRAERAWVDWPAEELGLAGQQEIKGLALPSTRPSVGPDRSAAATAVLKTRGSKPETQPTKLRNSTRKSRTQERICKRS